MGGAGTPSHWKYDLSKKKFYRVIVVVFIIVSILSTIILWLVEREMNASEDRSPAESREDENDAEEEVPEQTNAAFDRSVTFRLGDGETYHFPDGLKVSLKEINDSRCPEDVVCIWAGELSATLIAVVDGKATEVTLGQTTATELEQQGYTFTLEGISEETVRVMVSTSSR